MRLQEESAACRKLAAEATELEGLDRYVEAYKKYLACCHKVTNTLAQELTALSIGNMTMRFELAKLNKHCAERIFTLCEMMNESKSFNTSHSRSSSLGEVKDNVKRESSLSRNRSVPAGTKRLDAADTKHVVMPSDPTSAEEVDVVMEAQQYNSLLFQNHQKKMERMKPSAALRATLDFEMRKKLIENIEIAKSRKSKVALKLEELQNTMQERAERRLASLNEVMRDMSDYKEKLTAVMVHDERYKWPLQIRDSFTHSQEFDFHSAKELCISILRHKIHPLTKIIDECADRVIQSIDPLFTKYGPVINDCVLVPDAEQTLPEFSYLELQVTDDCKSVQNFPEIFEEAKDQVEKAIEENKKCIDALEDSNDDMDSLFDSDEEVEDTALQNSNLTTKSVDDRQSELFDEIDTFQQAFEKQLNTSSDDVLRTMHIVTKLFRSAYDCLDCDDGEEVAQETIEESLFTQIGNHLLFMFRLCNCKEERQMANVMTKLRDTPITDQKVYGVKKKWCLDDKGECYNHLVKKMHTLANPVTMLNQITCAVSVIHGVTSTVVTHAKGCKDQMGADDLIPIICFIISKSQMPSIISHSEMLCKFTPQRFMVQEEGWCIASFELAVKHLLTL